MQKIIEFENKIINIKPLMVMLLFGINFSCGSTFGYSVGLTGVAKEALDLDYSEIFANNTAGPTLQALFAGGYFGGLIFGPTSAPIMIYLLGFKISLIFSSLAGIFGQLFSVFSANYYMLVVGRFIIGLSVGVNIVAGTEYSGTLAPKEFKGIIGATFLVGVTSNILLANITVFFSNVIFTWRWMVFIGLIPHVILFFFSIIIPESPIWRQGKLEKSSLTVPQQTKKLCCRFKNFFRMFLCFILIISFVLGGVVPMVNFLPYTLQLSGITDFYVRTGASIGVAVVNIITALTTTLFVNLFGRKILLGVGYVIMFTATFTMGFIVHFVAPPTSGYIAIGLACLFLVGNNGGINSIIFFIFNELFDHEITLVSSALMFSLFTIMEFISSFVYLPLQNLLGLDGVLWLFSCTTFVCGVILMIFLPETKIKNKKKKLEAVINPDIEIPETEEKNESSKVQTQEGNETIIERITENKTVEEVGENNVQIFNDQKEDPIFVEENVSKEEIDESLPSQEQNK